MFLKDNVRMAVVAKLGIATHQLMTYGDESARNFAVEHLNESLKLLTTPEAPAFVPTPLLPAEKVVAAKGYKIDAIKLLRERCNIGLKEAKDSVEAYTATL